MVGRPAPSWNSRYFERSPPRLAAGIMAKNRLDVRAGIDKWSLNLVVIVSPLLWGTEFRPPETLSTDYLSAMVFPISVPITSPEITSSTRRFCCRPAAVRSEEHTSELQSPYVISYA